MILSYFVLSKYIFLQFYQGPVNHIVSHLKRLSPSVVTTIEELHIQPSKYHGRQYEGNQCRKLLKSVKKLKIPPYLVEFENVLIALGKLHCMCNADHLPHNYVNVIDNFITAWFKLTEKFAVSTTPKIHIILHHLCDYFNEMNVTLKLVTDELVEHMHKFVEKRMSVSGYIVKDISNISHV